MHAEVVIYLLSNQNMNIVASCQYYFCTCCFYQSPYTRVQRLH